MKSKKQRGVFSRFWRKEKPVPEHISVILAGLASTQQIPWRFILEMIAENMDVILQKK